MTPAEEKELKRRMNVMERQITELRRMLGANDADLEKMELNDAIEYMAEYGDPSMINQFLVKTNKIEQSMQCNSGGQRGRGLVVTVFNGDTHAS